MRFSTEEVSDSPSPPPISRRSKHHHRLRPVSPSPSPSEPADGETNSVDHEQSSNPDNSNEFDTDIVDSENSTQPNSSYSSSNLIPHNYINVAPLPVFRGAPDDCPVAHLFRFERVARANNAASLGMMLRIFPVTLDGEAALWYELNVGPFPDISWEEIKSSFLKAFRRPEFVDKARTDLMTIKQGENETVNAFYLRMQWILTKWPDHGLPDSLLKGIFVDGLREDFQDWIVPQWPESLEEAVRMATSWEQAQSVRARRREANCGFCEGKHEESGCEVRRKMKEMWMKSKDGFVETGEGTKAEEASKEGMGRVVSLGRRSQCQCWKHQCSRKLERSSSVTSEKNVNLE